MRLPSTRTRVAAAFAAVMVGLSAAIGLAVYRSVGSALLDEVDTALRFRAAAYSARPQQPPSPRIDPRLAEPRESFFQVLTRDGRLIDRSAGLTAGSLLPVALVTHLHGPVFRTQRVPGVQDAARILALPDGTRRVLVVGETLADRTDALRQLATVLWIGFPAGIAAASLAGWFVAGLGLRPVERMRRQAAAISRSDNDHRLDVPRPKDELHRLATTLNEMLDRLGAAAQRDRHFMMRAGHELRTPLTSLQAELELAETGPQDSATLGAAVRSAADEADRLVALASSLLAEARINDGRLPVTRTRCSLPDLLEATASAHAARAARHGVAITASSRPVTVRVDALRVRQALDNLVDNALRHADDLSSVRLTAECRGDALVLSVTDDGRGRSGATDGATAQLSAGEGIGLRVVEAVAAAHGGGVTVRPERSRGFTATLTLAAVEAQPAPRP